MKFITALTERISVGYVPDEVSLSVAFANSHDWRKTITETHALVVLVCFEAQDVADDVKTAAAAIDTIFRRYKSEVFTICLVPFAHLSLTTLGDPEKAEILLSKLQRHLSYNGARVVCVPVGQGNIFMSQFLFFDKFNTVKFQSSRNTLKEILKSLVRAYGLRKVAAVFTELIPTTNKPYSRKDRAV